MSEIPEDVMNDADTYAMMIASVFPLPSDSDQAIEGHAKSKRIVADLVAKAILADRQRDQWRDFSTAPKTGRFLVIASGHTERPHFDDPACIVTINAPDGPMTCEGFESETGYIDEFGEQYGPDGRVEDAEDLNAEDDILRLILWMPLPAAPKGE